MLLSITRVAPDSGGPAPRCRRSEHPHGLFARIETDQDALTESHDLGGQVAAQGERGIHRSRSGTALGDHAVVVGAGVAGLVAARVLADHLARVTVVDRDRLPVEPVPRPGVPQSHNTHILLARGMAVLE